VVADAKTRLLLPEARQQRRIRIASNTPESDTSTTRIRRRNATRATNSSTTRLGTGDVWIGRRLPCITTALRTGRRIHGSREAVQANAADAGQQKSQLGAVGVRQEAFRKAILHRYNYHRPHTALKGLPVYRTLTVMNLHGCNT
jgi:hypothetical protein